MIHTTQGSVIKAHKTLNRLYEEKMSVRLAYSLFSMRKSTESFCSFSGGERQREIFKEYANGMESEALTFKTNEDKEKFVKEMTDLAPMEVNVDTEPVRIPLSMKRAHKKHITLNPNKKRGAFAPLIFLFFFYKIFNPN